MSHAGYQCQIGWIGLKCAESELTFGGGVVPADLGQRPNEGQLGHVVGAAVTVVVVVPLATLVLVSARRKQIGRGSLVFVGRNSHSHTHIKHVAYSDILSHKF